jgi:hypothetical protein
MLSYRFVIFAIIFVFGKLGIDSVEGKAEEMILKTG